MRHERFIFLDILRFVAIIMVVLRHVIFAYEEQFGVLFPQDDYFANFAKNGWSGVDLFFVLSGFLIANQWLFYSGGEEGFGVRVVRYGVKRALRILPLYFFILLVSSIHYVLSGGEFFFQQLLVHILFLQDYSGTALLAPLWSLAVEWKFYLMAPFLLYVCQKRLGVGFALLVAVLFISLLFRLMAGWEQIGEAYNFYFWQVRSPFHQALDGLVLGVLAALVYNRCKSEKISLFPSVFFTVAVLLICYVLSQQLFMCDGCAVASAWAVHFVSWLFFFLVCAAVLIRPPKLPLAVISFFRGGSILSYGVYLVHMAFIPSALNLVLPGLMLFGTVGGFLVTVVIVLAFSYLASWVLYRLIEVPVYRFRKKLLSARGRGW